MFYRWMALIAAAVVFAGCQSAKTPDIGQDSRLVVYASFYPMADFAQKIGGDKVDVTNMTPPGGEPHDWEPTPADMSALAKADVFIYNGAGLEHWVDKVLGSIDATELAVVCVSDGVELLEDEEGSNLDPHVWLSLPRAQKQMENIKNAFVQADPDNADFYEENYRQYAQAFDELYAEYEVKLADFEGGNIVVSHAAFGYMCHDFGLKQIAVEGLTPYSEPDAATISDIIRFINENGVKVVFCEAYGSSKTADMLAKETGVRVDTLNIIEGLSDEEIAGGEDYLSIMSGNLEALAGAFI